MKYILALDQGTTSSRAILFDKKSNIVGVAQKEFTQIYPKPGLVEHNPMEIWASQLGVLTECLANHSVSLSDVAAIGITNQRETTVVWNKNTGEPIYNAIVWQDKRTSDYCSKLKNENKEEIVTKKTGLVLDPYFSASKIKWILDNVKGARKQAENGIIWKLTNKQVHATDYSNASRTMLFNIHTCKWDDELLDMFSIPKKMLPEVKQSSEIFGNIHVDILGAEVPIAGIAGDQQAATFGQACLKPGMAKNTYGTGCFCLLNTGKDAITNNDKILTTVAWGRKNSVTYALEGSVFIGGAVVQWIRDELDFIPKSSDIEELAKKVPNNGGVYLVPAFAGLGAPYWDPYARGVLVGLTRGSNRSHIARAALEGIALQSYDILQAMQNVTKNVTLNELRVDGGASCNNFLMQLQADILNCKVVRPKVTETTALGAAYLAGLATKFWESADEIASLWQVDKIFEPQMKQDERENLIYTWHKAVQRAQKWEE
ncbi:UNVERIFIED_CONTAM: hypothetical protein PYX00_011097 [Menopon gallinae]|uniref:glycerol kinase n=1 Tax=Menopon gallinae TaxID=328185 RepID=A0AAW2H5X7_9NEOP